MEKICFCKNEIDVYSLQHFIERHTGYIHNISNANGFYGESEDMYAILSMHLKILRNQVALQQRAYLKESYHSLKLVSTPAG